MDAQQGTPPNSPPPAETEDEEAQIQRDASLFLQFLQSDPGGRAYIDRTIRQHLQGGVGPETWGKILDGLVLYAGEQVAHFVLLASLSADELLNPDEADYLPLVERYVGVEAWSYLRGLLAMYGADLKEAYVTATENPQAWRTVNSRMFYNEMTQQWQATFEIVKYNGERVYLEETPTSAIVLCGAILDTLNFMPVEVAQQVADRETIEGVINLFYTFVEHFAPDVLEEES